MDWPLLKFSSSEAVDSALIVFPDKGDLILNPENNLLWYRTVVDWMRKYSNQKS